MSDYGSELAGTTNPPDAEKIGVVLPGVHDGIAYWIMPDGKLVNCWPLETRRGQIIQQIIDGTVPYYPPDKAPPA